MTGPRPTLLVVDDEPEVLRSMQDLFRPDYRVIAFEGGQAALEAMAAEPDVHVIISDQQMPRMSGVEFLRRARLIHPQATRLLMTGFADIRAVIGAINEGGVFRYITKPCDPDELIGLVRQGVEQHNLITERTRLVDDLTRTNASLVEANRLKTAFIEVASHELNTPVAVVLGMSELWRMSQGKEATKAERDWVDRIHAAGKRLAGSVERMLKLLRADRFDRTLDIQEVDLGSLLDRSLADLDPFLRARHQHVVVNADRLGSAEVDPAKMHDVFANLIVNAIKFTADGGTIRVDACDVGGNAVKFTVIDEGIGICADDRPHLFEPFFTGYDTMHHSSGDFQYCKKGIGLGLCLVKAFVELHGGHVAVISKPGEGSTFSFTIPRKQKSYSIEPTPAAASLPLASSVNRSTSPEKPDVLRVGLASTIR
ncbi:hybrid sensor histidine kinase/response regulator [Isosphaeraceae bacterium EP7]